MLVEIRERYQLRKDSQAMLTRSLLGDATLEFAPGTSRELLRPGDRVEGAPSVDPLEIISRMEAKTNETLQSFASTSEEWRKVGKNINDLSATHRGNIDQLIEEAAESLHHFTLTMRSVNKTIADPQSQENMRKTLAALPKMTEDAVETIQAIRQAVGKAELALGNISELTTPLAKRSSNIAVRLDNSIASLETLLRELALFSKSINGENGSLALLAKDPQLYRNLTESAASLSLIMRNLEPTMKDLRIFADKIARHPEKLGIDGTLHPDSGIKEARKQ